MQLTAVSNVTSMAGGLAHSLAVTSTGAVWAWGSNGNGQLGDGTTTDHNVPTLVGSVTGATQVAAGDLFSLALKSDGTVWAWGYGANGQLGDNGWSTRTSPVQVHGVNNTGFLTGITGIGSSAGEHSLAFKSDGTGYAWV